MRTFVQPNPRPAGDSKTVRFPTADGSETALATSTQKSNLPSIAPSGVDENPLVKKCDWLAADPADKSRPAGVPGVYFAALEAASAIEACRSALARFPASARIQFELGRALMKNWYYDEAFAIMKPAAEAGYAPAQDGIGRIYDSKPGVWPDYADAMTWYQKAANQGCAPAQYHVGKLYENGYGVTKDIGEAKAWYQKAADQGYPDATDALKRLTK